MSDIEVAGSGKKRGDVFNLAKYVGKVEDIVGDSMNDMYIIIEDGLYNVKNKNDFVNVIGDLIDQAIKLQLKLEELRQNFKRGVDIE
jgi:hypothetical protein